MIVKETPWEKRNLGVDSSIEFYVDVNDTLEDIKEIWNDTSDYQILHIESGQSHALLSAQEHGFRLIEMNIQLSRNLESVELPPMLQRYERVLKYRYADDKEELETILKIVDSGEMFLTDKVALDPFFGAKKAGERYAHWARDILSCDGITIVTLYKDTPVGFEIFQEEGNKCTNFIGGVYPKYMNRGLGFAPIYTELLAQKERGNRSVQTGVSSNNVSVLRVHEMLGFKVHEMSYLLIKHK